MSQPEMLVEKRARTRRRNTAVALVFGLALCLGGVAFAVTTLSAVDDQVDATLTAAPSTPAAAAPVPAASSDPAVAPVTPPPVAVVSKGFLSPSGNIGCRISVELARCDIVEKTWDPGAPPETCAGTWGPGVQVDAVGPSVVCASDSAVGPGPILGYGQTITEGTFVCASSEAGMRCENTATTQGFALSRRAYTFF